MKLLLLILGKVGVGCHGEAACRHADTYDDAFGQRYGGAAGGIELVKVMGFFQCWRVVFLGMHHFGEFFVELKK